MTRFFSLILLASLFGCQESAPEPTPEAPSAPSIPFDIAGDLTFSRDGQPITTIAIEVADTDSLRMRGMMDRTEIPDATGMLFIFPTAAPQSFWMQNTPSALDIMYFGADSTLINVQANAVPFQTNPTYPSEGPAQFVVETPAGFARRYGLTPGVRIDWDLDTEEAPASETAP
ncbi:DUF192 domain-containing protein [Rubricoccus marinus]|uniref:DUF192 domain-containing protein n=1 Tax=Rubricoccus marinus TaxID=716817 RepID=A0A259TZL4_9BACT|nr:DUF192 domain-containing protein [Rubricoccus marinus]OZC03126.1 hypothetical protein BSZ36_09155 [Rubricoccus marinus]